MNYINRVSTTSNAKSSRQFTYLTDETKLSKVGLKVEFDKIIGLLLYHFTSNRITRLMKYLKCPMVYYGVFNDAVGLLGLM